MPLGRKREDGTRQSTMTSYKAPPATLLKDHYNTNGQEEPRPACGMIGQASESPRMFHP